jgi:S-adenosyl-L-methionine hydrolase (adenosine-forming)
VAERRRITLLTDFGTADGYVAAMKGVIAAIFPDAFIDDVAHDIPPGDVHAAAWALAGYWRLYPSGTVHVAVVDPGVGSARRALAATVEGRFFVAPDNGVLTRVFADASAFTAVTIDNETFFRDMVSATFHGRDVFAPVAAHLAGGVSLRELGRAIHDPVKLDLPEPQRVGDVVTGAVVHVDRYGNLVTNIPAVWVQGSSHVRIAGRELPLRRTYTDVAPGEALALSGSRGTLELSVRDGNAADLLSVGRGAEVLVR